MKDLSGLLQLDPGTLSPLLKRLEAAGLRAARTAIRATSARSPSRSPTAGRALREQAERIPPGIVDRLGMDLAELTALHETLSRVIDASRRALDDAPDCELIHFSWCPNRWRTQQ